MNATVTLPNGKELSFVKGEKGVETLFITKDNGVLVVVTETETLNFANLPVIVSYPPKDIK